MFCACIRIRSFKDPFQLSQTLNKQSNSDPIPTWFLKNVLQFLFIHINVVNLSLSSSHFHTISNKFRNSS